MIKYEIQIDCDDFWVYEQDDSFRFNENMKFDIYKDSINKILEHLGQYKLKATFFVVGRDIKLNSNAKSVIQNIINLGHEVGNHTLNHRNDYHFITQNEAYAEIIDNHELIKSEFNYTCTKFRAPGYNFREDQVEYLELLGYKFEDSNWFSVIIPLLNFYFKVVVGSIKRIETGFQGKHSEANSLHFRSIMITKWLKTPFHVTFFYLYPKLVIRFLLRFNLVSGEIFLIHAKDYLLKRNMKNFMKKIDLVFQYISKEH